MTTDSDTVVLYHQSSAMFIIIYAEFSGESWDFCNSILLPAWRSLCVYLHMISLDSKFWWPNSCHSTHSHTKIGSSNSNTNTFCCYFCWIAMLLSWLLSPPPPTPYRSVEHHINSTPPPPQYVSVIISDMGWEISIPFVSWFCASAQGLIMFQIINQFHIYLVF